MKISFGNQIEFFTPVKIFFSLTVFFIIIPQAIIYQAGNASLIDIWVFMICVIGCLAFCFGSKHRYKLKFKANSNTKIFSFVAIIFLLIDFYTALQNFVASEVLEYRISFQITNYLSIYKQLIYIVLLYIKFYSISVLIAKSKKLFWVTFLIEFFCYIGSPVRLIALMPIIIFTIYGFYRSYIKITFIRSIFIVCFSPFVFVILLLTRGGTGYYSFYQKLLNTISNFNIEHFSQVLLAALESFMSYLYLKWVVAENLVATESGILRNVFLPISRSIWEDKPESISRIIAKKFNNQQYIEGGGSVATIFGDGFINLHVVGVFLICLLAGFGLKLVYNGIKVKENLQEKSIRIMLYALSVHQFLFFYRGFLSETYWKFIILILIFKLLNVLNIKLNRHA